MSRAQSASEAVVVVLRVLESGALGFDDEEEVLDAGWWTGGS
jgi:hypothetical protein